MGIRKEMIGLEFGSLLVTSCKGSKGEQSYETYWECKCKCGSVTTKRGSTLRCGATTSCGKSCPYTPWRKDPLAYQELEKASNWIMLFTKIPDKVSTKAKWQCRTCNQTQSVTYNNVLKYTAGYEKYTERKHSGCMNCFRKHQAKHPHREVAQEEIARRIEEKGCVLLSKPIKDTRTKATFKCTDTECNHEFDQSLYGLTSSTGCPKCSGYVNGVPASKPQIAVAELLGAEVNYKIGARTVDGALVSSKIAIEYDGYHWHAYRGQKDKLRNKAILDEGWSLLRIRSGARVPELWRLNYAIQKINEGRKHYRMTLKDWGKGNTAFNENGQKNYVGPIKI